MYFAKRKQNNSLFNNKIPDIIRIQSWIICVVILFGRSPQTCEEQAAQNNIYIAFFLSFMCPKKSFQDELLYHFSKEKHSLEVLFICIISATPNYFQHATKKIRLTSTILIIWGRRRSMRTSSNITRARQTFLRTSGSSSVASAKRFYWKALSFYKSQCT